ncbi:sugar phosphate isomerase/epimerase [Saccharopolyspora gloriosae]|uniref:sugar phosphate isomerase/epimerase family protein n=1 Tax=Saccharopolyspora gloriosae TaxID=455344 RepID=UPI001FB60067|nr:sugar phosphate isomerase/epimerase [Saccharopolyspora gloriosae]
MPELGCSTISFRQRTAADALAIIRDLGFDGIDLGGLPGVCDHIPTPLTGSPEHLVDLVRRSGLRTWAINVDPGPLNDPALDEHDLLESGRALVELAASLDAAMIVPCGAQHREPFADETTDLDRIAHGLRLLGALAAERGVRLLVEGLHHYRFCHTAERAGALLERVPVASAGFVFDVSHVVAGGFDEVALAREFADRIEHVHFRDAEPGDINLSIGRGRADFAGVVRTLREHGYTGRYVLELETHDVADEDRPAAAAAARADIAALLGS